MANQKSWQIFPITLQQRVAELEYENKQLLQQLQDYANQHSETVSVPKVRLDYMLSSETDIPKINLLDLVEVEDLQHIQDAFAKSTGVASIITDLQGVPITQASNFCGVCQIIRTTEKGTEKCFKSDKVLGEKAKSLMRPTYEECLSCGFVDASAPIIVAGQHIANWLIGQVNVVDKNLGVDKQRLEEYASEIGADREAMLKAYQSVSIMSLERFEQILNFLWVLAKKISTLGYNNLQLQKDIKALHRAEEALQKSHDNLEKQVAERTQEITLLNHRLKAENVRMSTELEVTRRLQQMLLPKAKELNEIDGLDIAVFMEPAAEVGGDYYDVLQYDGHVKIGIGDVTGHGLESGVLMLMVQTAVRTLLANQVSDPKIFLNVLNRAVYDNIKRMNSDKNLTLSLLDYKAGLLRLSGQHEEVLLVRKDGIVTRIDTIDLGFMVGLESDINQFISQLEIKLQPGDGVVLYTDGITEARNSVGELYTVERLCKEVSRCWHLSATEIKKAIIANVKQYIGTQKVLDDITLLVIKQK